jgi:hypothetical protein
VEDALDIAALFIEATNRSINPIGSEFSMSNLDEYVQATGHFSNELWFRFDTEDKISSIRGLRGVSGELLNRTSTFVGQVLINPEKFSLL